MSFLGGVASAASSAMGSVGSVGGAAAAAASAAAGAAGGAGGGGSSQRTWTPAKLIFLEPGAAGAEKKVWEIEFPYNPSTFSMTKGAKWQQNSNKDGLMPAEYHGPVPSSINVKMFLDETTSDNGDISKIVKKILQQVNPDPKSVSKEKPSAPYVRFLWGQAIEFKGYISSAAVEYTLFRENGNPVRGTVTLTLNEFGMAEKAQNPTSGGEPGSRAHRVVAGDTLASIAYDEYGSAADWRRIANANSSISDPLRLQPGTSLVIPPA